jgi:uncharacterized protein
MKVLITGGSGMIGKVLTEKLLHAGHQVNVLTRKITRQTGAHEFLWNNQDLDTKALDGVEVLVHLAGAGIADKKWTNERKHEIINSRVKTLELIADKYNGSSLKAIIGGSAIGFYGGDSGEKQNDENSPSGNDFMAECCTKWEAAEENFAEKFGLRLVKIRTGIVLSSEEGALPKITLPIKYGVGSPLGSGRQWMSWIHIDDIVEIFYQAITQDEISGTINGVAKEPVRNQTLTRSVAKTLNRKIFLPNVPAFLLKILLGEMAVVILGSSNVKNSRPLPFSLKFNKIDEALKDLVG